MKGRRKVFYSVHLTSGNHFLLENIYIKNKMDGDAGHGTPHNERKCLMKCDVCRNSIMPSKCDENSIVKSTKKFLKNVGEPVCYNCNYTERPCFETQLENLIQYCKRKRDDEHFEIYPHPKMVYMFNSLADKYINSYSC